MSKCAVMDEVSHCEFRIIILGLKSKRKKVDSLVKAEYIIKTSGNRKRQLAGIPLQELP